jgi:hypothetical protein
MKPISFSLLIFFAVLTLNSCLGVQADISIRPDGSGRIVLEYRVSQMLESIGRLDGNERWPAIPVGRTDFERSIARIPGLRLVSFSAQDVRRTSETQRTSGAAGSHDLVTTATVEFANTAALVAFLDYTGNRATIVQNNALRLVLLESAANAANAELLSLLREVSEGYSVGISLSAPGNASLAVLPQTAAARVVPMGRKVSFAIDMGDLMGLENGLALEINW